MNPPSRRLEFSRSVPGAEQRLLFDETAPIIPADPAAAPVAERFYADGFALLSGIATAAEARAAVECLLAHLDLRRLPLFARFAGRVQLAKADRIPVCHDIVPRSFQALHFDMGQPIVSDLTQTMYLLLGLYRPPGEGPSSAATRVVGLRRLLGQRDWPDRAVLERRLIDYARRHGDGWFAPDTVNTGRLACFARVLDAVTARNELTHYVDKSTGDWFQDERHRDGSVGLANETAYYRGCGLDLSGAEGRVCLQAGELLVVDNLRAVHGRYGPRRPAEIYQFLYGVRSATPADIDAFRGELVDAFRS